MPSRTLIMFNIPGERVPCGRHHVFLVRSPRHNLSRHHLELHQGKYTEPLSVSGLPGLAFSRPKKQSWPFFLIGAKRKLNGYKLQRHNFFVLHYCESWALINGLIDSCNVRFLDLLCYLRLICSLTIY